MSPFLLIIIADIEAFFLRRIDSSYFRKQNGLGLGGTKQYNHLKNSGDENERNMSTDVLQSPSQRNLNLMMINLCCMRDFKVDRGVD